MQERNGPRGSFKKELPSVVFYAPCDRVTKATAAQRQPSSWGACLLNSPCHLCF